MNIRAFGTHTRPHLSDLGAIALFRLNRECCPGSDAAPIFYWRGGTPAELRTFVQSIAASVGCLVGEVMLVGIGGGVCDEHPFDGESRKEGESEMSLAAKLLGIEKDPPLQRILEYVTAEDWGGSKDPFCLANLIKLRYEYNPNAEEAAEELLNNFVVPLIHQAYESYYVRLETEAAVERETVVDARTGKSHVIANVVTGDQGIVGFLLSGRGGSASIVIVQDPRNGCIRIVATKHKKVFRALEDTVRVIRIWERRAAGITRALPFCELAVEGSVRGAEQWYFQAKAQSLFYGTKTHPDIPKTNPTKLSFQQLREAVKIGLSGAFEPSRAGVCNDGLCSDTAQSPCPWYEFGLPQCRQIRWNLAETLREIDIDYGEICKRYP